MIDLATIANVTKDLVIVLSAPLIRSVTGWGAKALADNKVTHFEIEQLLATIIRVGTIGIMGYFGLSLLGIENAHFAAAIGAFFADKLFNALKQNKPVTQQIGL